MRGSSVYEMGWAHPFSAHTYLEITISITQKTGLNHCHETEHQKLILLHTHCLEMLSSVVIHERLNKLRIELSISY